MKTINQTIEPVSVETLKQRWDALRDRQPPLRIREAAAFLQVSEAELLATGCGDNVTRLEAEVVALLNEVPSLGEVLALTRNDHAVHEKSGRYGALTLSDGRGRIQGDNIDLLLDLSHWHAAFAVTERSRHGVRDSLQFFDRDGTAVHKIYMTENSDCSAYRALVERYRSADQSQRQTVQGCMRSSRSVIDAVDIETQDWPWHEPLIAGRMVPYQNAEALRTKRLPLTAFRHVMHTVSDSDAPIQVWVGNDGALQMHSGPIDKLVVTGPWFNVLDDGFNWHLKEDALAELRWVERSNGNASVTLLELCDRDGCLIAMLGADAAVWSQCLPSDDNSMNSEIMK